MENMSYFLFVAAIAYVIQDVGSNTSDANATAYTGLLSTLKS